MIHPRMAFTEKDLQRFGPAAQAQIRCELARREAEQKARRVQKSAAARPKLPQPGSNLEQQYYTTVIWPRMLAGQVVSCELQKRFELYPADTYCGVRLPAAHYTPDFFVTYTNGLVEAIEVKHAAIRRLQRDYIYRRRLFIELYARPNGWKFTEYIQEDTP